MSGCCIVNCTSTNNGGDISYFRFPKDESIRQQWIKASRIEKDINTARICSLHFEDKCFQMKRTKPRTKNVPSKEIRRLDKNAVSSLLLDLEKKTKIKAKVRPVLPTSAELVNYARQQTSNHSKETSVQEDIPETNTNTDTLGLGAGKKKTNTRNKKSVDKPNVSRTKLLQLLLKEIKEKEMLLQENDKLKSEIIQRTVPMHVLQKVFTPGQIKLLMSPNPGIRIQWSAEDITSAIALRSISPKAYRYLRNVRKMPLPSETTLYKWGIAFNIPPGILTNVLNIMKEKGQNLCIEEKLTVLTFDKLYISYGLHKTCQFVMARGLFHTWKQPIYYEFDKPLSAHTLLTIISSLFEVQYIVVAVTSDTGPYNIKLWNELNIGINITTDTQRHNTQKTIGKQHFIVHPANSSLKIFFFADIPHLLKLARNNLLDSGFTIHGNNINKTCLEELLTLNARELKIVHKFSQAHLDVKGAQRQKVKLAEQLFSNTNAKAIQWCGEQGLLKSVQWKQTADVLQLFNDWFDLFNAKYEYEHTNISHAYGNNLEEQNTILHRMDEFIQTMRVGKRSAPLQFQKGIMLSNESLRDMFLYIQQRYSSEARPIQYLLTSRLNQDVLENMFSYLRICEGYDQFTPGELRNRLKWYILGKHSEYTIVSNTNIAGDNSTILTCIDDSSCEVTSAPQKRCMVDEEEEEEDEEESCLIIDET